MANIIETKKFQKKCYRIISLPKVGKVKLQVEAVVMPIWVDIKTYIVDEEYDLDFQIMEAKELLDEICK